MVVDHLIVLVHGSFVHISASSLSGRSRRWREILSFCDSFEKDVLKLEDAEAIHLPDADQPHSLVGRVERPAQPRFVSNVGNGLCTLAHFCYGIFEQNDHARG